MFKRTNAPRAHGPALTVTTGGTLNLNVAAFELLGQPEAVNLLYARDERIIGLRPARRDELDAYPVRSSRPGRPPMVSAKAFCEPIGADLTSARRYPLVLDDGIGRVDLKESGTVVTSNRAK